MDVIKNSDGERLVATDFREKSDKMDGGRESVRPVLRGAEKARQLLEVEAVWLHRKKPVAASWEQEDEEEDAEKSDALDMRTGKVAECPQAGVLTHGDACVVAGPKRVWTARSIFLGLV